MAPSGHACRMCGPFLSRWTSFLQGLTKVFADSKPGFVCLRAHNFGVTGDMRQHGSKRQISTDATNAGWAKQFKDSAALIRFHVLEPLEANTMLLGRLPCSSLPPNKVGQAAYRLTPSLLQQIDGYRISFSETCLCLQYIHIHIHIYIYIYIIYIYTWNHTTHTLLLLLTLKEDELISKA